MSGDRPYVGATWKDGLFDGPMVLASLEIIARDLRVDATLAFVTGPVIELWKHVDEGLKGFFVGETGELVSLGWTKLATL
jgi:hypothetical protein